LSNGMRINKIGRDWEALADQPGSLPPRSITGERVQTSFDRLRIHLTQLQSHHRKAIARRLRASLNRA
jgi:hypothetical protein